MKQESAPTDWPASSSAETRDLDNMSNKYCSSTSSTEAAGAYNGIYRWAWLGVTSDLEILRLYYGSLICNSAAMQQLCCTLIDIIEEKAAQAVSPS
jgi:hypothetical protein